MAKRSIRADEILTDIMSGMGDTGLMEKYNLSASALLKIMTKLLWKGLLSPVAFSWPDPQKLSSFLVKT